VWSLLKSQERVETSTQALQQIAVEFVFLPGAACSSSTIHFLRGYQARAPQVGKMPGSRRLGNLQYFHEIPDAQFAVEQKMQDSQARGIGKARNIKFTCVCAMAKYIA